MTAAQVIELLLASHRMNAVVDPRPDFPAWTRVKCDGAECDFYAEGERYWDVVRDHNAHVAAVLLAEGWHRGGEVEPDLRPAIIRGLEARFKAVLAACELAEAEARHVVDDEVYVSVGLIRNALATPTPPAQDGAR